MLSDLEVEMTQLNHKINQLQGELDRANSEKNSLLDAQLQFEGRLEKRDTEIMGLKEERERLRDGLKGKDAAIEALTLTLIEKGETNRLLTEKVAEVKNHQLATNFLN